MRAQDTERLVELAQRVRAISEQPVNQERRTAWLAHHGLKGTRPMVLIEAHEVIRLVDFESRLRCEGEWAREVEQQLLARIWRFEELQDDAVVEPVVNCSWRVEKGNFGVELDEESSDSGHALESKQWTPVLHNLDADLEQLQFRSLAADRVRSAREMEQLQDLLGDILHVRRRGAFCPFWWTTGLTAHAIQLVGMENFMMSMFDNPDGLHRLMAFLRDDQMQLIDRLEEEKLFTLNNEDDYVGSGTVGYVPDLPRREMDPDGPAQAKDLWVLSESQETVGCSPAQFAEFVLPYQLPIIERFGLSYYGCCEPVHERWEQIKTIPNLRAVSVSPWCDQAFMADALKRDYVYCRKPNPTLISTQVFDEDALREDLQETLNVAGDCNLEIVMKDIHTLDNEPERAARWVQIAREECKATD
jgi:hypothetical protein